MASDWKSPGSVYWKPQRARVPGKMATGRREKITCSQRSWRPSGRARLDPRLRNGTCNMPQAGF
jgi:hypothetical protein